MKMKKSDKLAIAQTQLNLLSPYTNKWVALNNDKTIVIASGGTISEVETKLLKNKGKASEILYVAPFDQYHVPLCK